MRSLRNLFRRWPFTLVLGSTVMLFLLASIVCGFIAFSDWESPGTGAIPFAKASVTLERVATFLPSLFRHSHSAYPQSVTPAWFYPLTWTHGFLLGAILDIIFRRRPRHETSFHNDRNAS